MITLKNMDTGIIKTVPTGYSWTTFFFGFFPALFRGDLKWAIIFFIADGALTFITLPLLCVGVPIFNIIFAGFYNKIYIKELMGRHFTYADDTSRNYLIQHGIIGDTVKPATTNITQVNNEIDNTNDSEK